MCSHLVDEDERCSASDGAPAVFAQERSSPERESAGRWMASGRGLLFLAKVRRTTGYTAFYFRRWNRIVVGVLFLSKISKFRFHNTNGYSWSCLEAERRSARELADAHMPVCRIRRSPRRALCSRRCRILCLCETRDETSNLDQFSSYYVQTIDLVKPFSNSLM